MPRREQLPITALNPSSTDPQKARIHPAVPAPGISLYCQPVSVQFCSPLLDKFFLYSSCCTDMFIWQLIQPSMGFSNYFQWIKFYSGKRNVGMDLLSLSADSRGSCRSKNISPFVCLQTLPKYQRSPKIQAHLQNTGYLAQVILFKLLLQDTPL